jgi:hypothetical protein
MLYRNFTGKIPAGTQTTLHWFFAKHRPITEESEL